MFSDHSESFNALEELDLRACFVLEVMDSVREFGIRDIDPNRDSLTIEYDIPVIRFSDHILEVLHFLVFHSNNVILRVFGHFIVPAMVVLYTIAHFG